MAENSALEDLQAAMLSALSEGGSPESLRARLLADPRCRPFRAWVGEFDADMLEVAAQLVSKWGRRRTSDEG